MDNPEIITMRNQYQAGQWPQFLEMVQIAGLRGWSGQNVNFNFPVVAIVGENGTGKSTILKTAACAYEAIIKKDSFYPSSFFVKTHWDRIQNVTMNFRVKQGTTVRTFKISKLSQLWSLPETRPKRTVRIFDISRTLPLDLTVGYAKIAKAATTETATTDLAPDFRTRLSHVLGKDYTTARFAVSNVDSHREVGLLGSNIGEISQFHQGAGEDATLDLFQVVQNIPDYTLLIIDEVEASLHPKAQRRLIRFLLWLSRQKRVQVILSTHSPYVLEELPQEARILLLPGILGLNVLYGVTPEFAMSRIDESPHPESFVFVEDREAATFLREILASDPTTSEILPRLSISPVGPVNVIQMMGLLASQNKLPYHSIAFIDSDYPESPGCIKLPGNAAPEKVVYQDLKNNNWAGLPDRFGIGAGILFTVLEDAMRDPDHHKWNTLVGNQVIKSSSSVWETLVTHWARTCLLPTDRNRLHLAIQQSFESTHA